MKAAVRSLLFLPVDSERFLNKAPATAADALILDLEASVPQARKAAARERLPMAVDFLRRACDKAILVRINPRDVADAAACAAARVDAVVVPTVNTAEDLLSLSPLRATPGLGGQRHSAAAAVSPTPPAAPSPPEAVSGKGMPLFPLVETPLGLLNLRAILDTGLNFGGVMFGAEDFVLRLGPLARPCQDSLLPAAHAVAVTARAYGLPPYGIADSLAVVRDPARFAAACRQARSLGMAGSPVVHPGQAEVVNREFSPSPEEIAAAREAVAAFEEAGGAPVVAGGRMIDEPIDLRYRQLLDGMR